MFKLWAAIVFIGAFTYLTRALPFISRAKWLERASEAAWLERLGPVLLMAMMVSIVLPFVNQNIQSADWLPLAIGLLAVLKTLKIKPNAGLATMAGILGYWLGLVIAASLT